MTHTKTPEPIQIFELNENTGEKKLVFSGSAAHIVRCVNNHDALVEALELLSKHTEAQFKIGVGIGTKSREALHKARAVLAAVKD